MVQRLFSSPMSMKLLQSMCFPHLHFGTPLSMYRVQFEHIYVYPLQTIPSL